MQGLKRKQRRLWALAVAAALTVPATSAWSQGRSASDDDAAKEEPRSRRGLRGLLLDALRDDDDETPTPAPPAGTTAAPTAVADTAATRAPLSAAPAPAPLNADAALVASTDAAALAAATCLQAGEQDDAANIALLFGSGSEKGLVSADISSYLVGLCVPSSFTMQYQMNEYLLAKGAVHGFHAERSLEELAGYLEAAGVELGVKYDALQKDSALTEALSGNNDIDKAGYIFNQSRPLSENADMFALALAKLEADQQTGAKAIAARARSHALRSAFFLARGVYVSQHMTTAWADQIKRDDGIRDKLRVLVNSDKSNLVDNADALVEGLKSGGGKEMAGFTAFVTKNGKAVVGTLAGAVKVIRSFNTDVAEIPRLTDEEIEADLERLNEEWALPAEFLGADVYAAVNTAAEP